MVVEVIFGDLTDEIVAAYRKARRSVKFFGWTREGLPVHLVRAQ